MCIRDSLRILEQIKTELEAIPEQAPLRLWTKNEQLAYWLNLHNITIIIELTKQYPMKSLRPLLKGSRKEPALWDQKLMTVSGIPLSLNDVHDILVEKWDSTLVMYGLFQGYVGGPNTVSYTHLRAHETPEHLVCRLLLEKKKTNKL
eukprot:TRINITY_DN50153_c0_g1_i4.p1 TRINITY_DN50153_c0_g1~~TRINITY_DN50153_c0_g1_i4.p1  ORF type:complete len:147 (+),score=17.35 TRINITY_DN50153_c0_g1_i4:118-558(+)